MDLLTPEVRELSERSVLCWLATVSPNGQPNVSPKEVFCAGGANEFLIAHIASPGSLSNLRGQPKVCVSFVDVFSQKGFKLQGRGQIVEASDARFANVAPALQDMAGPKFAVRAVFLVEVTKVQVILAPSYRLFPDVTEAEQRQAAYLTYGVRPAEEHGSVSGQRIIPG